MKKSIKNMMHFAPICNVFNKSQNLLLFQNCNFISFTKNLPHAETSTIINVNNVVHA